jgi:hypothetical protein
LALKLPAVAVLVVAVLAGPAAVPGVGDLFGKKSSASALPAKANAASMTAAIVNRGVVVILFFIMMSG